MIKLFNYLRGYVEIRAEGFFVEKFINLCSACNIRIWDVKCIGENIYLFKMSTMACKRARISAGRTGTRIKIISKCGFPFLLYKVKMRKGFIIGSIFAVMMFIILTSFVWSIEITGNVDVDEKQILDALAEAGIKKGAFRYGINESDVQNTVMLKIDRLSWMWVYINGTKARVDVRERVLPPPIVDKYKPSNIIASVDGLVTDIVTTYGDSDVKVGDVVKKGELLISGVVSLGEDKYRLVNAEGKVFARTWREKTMQMPLSVKKYKKTDKKIAKKVVNLLGFDVLLYMDKSIPYKYYDETKVNKQFSFFGMFDLPVTYTNTIYEEKVEYTENLPYEDAVALAEKELGHQIEKELDSSAKIVSITSDNQMIGEMAEVTVVYECIEQIGEKVYLE